MSNRLSIAASFLATWALAAGNLSAATINFGYLPGPDNIPGTGDDVPYTTADITGFGGGRLIDNEYTAAGVTFSGNSGPSLGLIGGGFNSDNVFGSGNNTLLEGIRVGGTPSAPIGGITAFSAVFSLPQIQVGVDVFAFIGSSGTSVPLTFKLAGRTVATQTLTTTGAQLGARFTLTPGLPFDEIDFGLSGPNNGGIGIDNLIYNLPEPTTLTLLAAPALVLRRRR